MPGTFRPAPACWSGQQASILRPLVPQTSALPGCAMPRLNWCPTARWPGPGGPWPTGLFPLLQGGDALLLVGVRGFEPPTLWSRTRCATRLRYTPMSHRPDRSVRLRPDGCVTTRRTSRDPGVFLRGGCPDDRLRPTGPRRCRSSNVKERGTRRRPDSAISSWRGSPQNRMSWHPRRGLARKGCSQRGSFDPVRHGVCM